MLLMFVCKAVSEGNAEASKKAGGLPINSPLNSQTHVQSLTSSVTDIWTHTPHARAGSSLPLIGHHFVVVHVELAITDLARVDPAMRPL